MKDFPKENIIDKWLKENGNLEIEKQVENEYKEIMKTAVQELFSKLEKEHPNLFNVHSVEGREFINNYYYILEMEKQQIIDAYASGYIDGVAQNKITAEQYYNDNFKK
jgi:hypothetical protein